MKKKTPTLYYAGVAVLGAHVSAVAALVPAEERRHGRGHKDHSKDSHLDLCPGVFVHSQSSQQEAHKQGNDREAEMGIHPFDPSHKNEQETGEKADHRLVCEADRQLTPQKRLAWLRVCSGAGPPSDRGLFYIVIIRVSNCL